MKAFDPLHPAVELPTIVLNVDAILAAAATVGVVGEDAVVERLQRPLSPVSVALLAAIVVTFPITIAAAAGIVYAPGAVATA